MTTNDDRYANAVQAVEDYLYGYDPEGVAVYRVSSIVDEVTDAIISASRKVEAAVKEAS